jgi:hypothetical protein
MSIHGPNTGPATGLATLLLLGMLSGCALVPGESRVALERQIDSRHHHYQPPKNPELSGSHVAGVPKANPAWWMANSDDPLPWWWKPDAPLAERKRTWMLRNPLHNFTSYVMGVSDRHTHRYGIHAGDIWNDRGGFNATVTQAGPLLYLPMISCRGPLLEWYLGWRTSGSFGGALRLAQQDSDGTGPRGRSPLSKALAAGARNDQVDASVPRTTDSQPAPTETRATGQGAHAARPELVRLPPVES